MKPTKGQLKVLNKENITWKDTYIECEVLEPKDFDFTPGQYVSLKTGESAFRAYSLCSSTKVLPKISFVIETSHNGVGSNFIKKLNIGDEITFIGPSGKVALPNKVLNEPIYFVATGTGVSPAISILYQLSEMQYKGPVNLLFGVRSEKEIFFIKQLESFKKTLENFSYKFYISQPESQEYKPSRVTSDISTLANNLAYYFLSGHPAMVLEAKNILLQNGIPVDKIIEEGFSRNA